MISGEPIMRHVKKVYLKELYFWIDVGNDEELDGFLVTGCFAAIFSVHIAHYVSIISNSLEIRLNSA